MVLSSVCASWNIVNIISCRVLSHFHQTYISDALWDIAHFGVKRSKVKVTVEYSMLETALLAFTTPLGTVGRGLILNDLASSYIHLVRCWSSDVELTTVVFMLLSSPLPSLYVYWRLITQEYWSTQHISVFLDNWWRYVVQILDCARLQFYSEPSTAISIRFN